MMTHTFFSKSFCVTYMAKRLFGICLLLSTGLAQAAPLSFTTNAESNSISGIQSDPQGQATSGSLTSSVTTNNGSNLAFSDRAFATAAADASGHSGLAVEGIFPSGNQFNSLTATANFTQQFTNSSAVNQSFLYDFTIFGPTLTLADYAGLAVGDLNPPLSAFYSVEITVDHGTGPSTIFNSTGTLTGGRLGYDLITDGTNPFTGTLFGSEKNIFGYNFSGISSSISDIALPGETISISSTLTTGMRGPGFEVGGGATIGDPNNLSLGNGFSGNLTVVPVPAAFWLLISGVFGLVGAMRRTKQSALLLNT